MRRLAPVLIVVGAALLYPLAVLAFSGGPEFPSRDDCVVAITGEGEYEVVFGYRDTSREAVELRDQVVGSGFTGTEVEEDGCGRFRVSVDDVPSQEIGEEVIRQARTVGLEPTLEQEG